MESNPSQAGSPRSKPGILKRTAKGCLGVCMVLGIAIGGLMVWMSWPTERSVPDYIKDAELALESQALDAPEADNSDKQFAVAMTPSELAEVPQYDIDQTMYALHAIEKILNETSSFEELTAFVLQRDSDLVERDVAKLKRSLFATYKNLLDIKDDQKQVKNTFDLWCDVVKTRVASSNFDAGIGVAGLQFTAQADTETERIRLEEELENRKVAKELREKIRLVQDELLEFQFQYNNLYSKYVVEWDRLCSLRDEAFYASYNGSWDQAIDAATKAIKLAPNEREAHMLLAMALIESSDQSGPFSVEFPAVETIELNNSTGRVAAASALLERFVADRHSLHAPAHLLRGVIKMKEGNPDSAFVYFDQAAAYFPQHTKELNDKLNLYKKREYLRDSREGNRLLSLYKSLMSGSGYYSPEFQKARILIEQGKDSEARDMVFDHFQRRKNQGEWAKVLDDFRFSSLFLGTSLTKIQGADTDDFGVLLRDSSRWTNLYADRLQINLRNKSDVDLHNVSILLCVRFTDMFKNDYVAFPVERTVATLQAGETLSIEVTDIKKITSSELGKEKQFADIINYGAVLISDELIMWAGQESHADPAPVDQPSDGT